jgi:CRP/FNR family cyclic AMP-dependent transcriptional regulator
MMQKSLNSSTTIFRFLNNLPLFEGIDQQELALLAEVSWLKKLTRGELLFLQSDPSDCVYIVRRGAIAIQLSSPDGRELVINEMNQGDCFGELGILTGESRSAGAEAIVDSEVLIAPRDAFMKILERIPFLSRRLLEITASRLQDSTRREEALAFHDAEQRLASQLLQLEQSAVEKGYLTLSQEDLAQRVGLARQTVATILGRWRRRGWLLTGRGHIVLLNRHELSLLT